MKTLLETYRQQVSSDRNYQTWESIIEESTDRLIDLKYKSSAYNKLCDQINELSSYQAALQDYEKTVQAIADATEDFSSPEQRAIGYASDNVEAKVYSVLASEQFIETLSYYIDCGVECDSEVKPVNLPRFKF
jgi:predicted nuclease with TOPRIM domain